jgi:hypothetical protein
MKFRIFFGFAVLISAATAQQYAISTVAGGAPPETPVAGISLSLGTVWGVAPDGAGNVYLASSDLNSVFRLDPSETGTIRRPPRCRDRVLASNRAASGSPVTKSAEKMGSGRYRSCSDRLCDQNTGGRSPIPGKQGGHVPNHQQKQTLAPSPAPSSNRGSVGAAVRVMTMRSGIIDGAPGGHTMDRLLARRQVINRSWYAVIRQYGQCSAAELTAAATNSDCSLCCVMRLPPSASVPDHGRLPAPRAHPRQPFGSRLRVASLLGTWDKYNHTWREGAPGRTAAKHILPKPRLRSYVSESKLEENHSPASGGLAGFR